jgi:medium-chain acyl-[acyl-carrier-protein] hydrolase
MTPPTLGAHGDGDARADRWLPGVRPASDVARVFCFPHAGGGASTFAAWRSLLAPAIDVCAVQYPGREERLSETPFSSMSALIAALLGVFPREGRTPFALFGHSNGALVAYELAQALRRERAPEPSALIVSGCRSPELPRRRSPMHALPEAAFRAALGDLGGTAAELLANGPYMDLVSPGIRADFALHETYVWMTQSPLDVPVLALAGTHDPLARTEEIEGWRGHTRGAFELRRVPGGHLFIRDSRAAAIPLIRDFLVRHVAG